jgi:hypothetical protein
MPTTQMAALAKMINNGGKIPISLRTDLSRSNNNNATVASTITTMGDSDSVYFQDYDFIPNDQDNNDDPTMPDLLSSSDDEDSTDEDGENDGQESDDDEVTPRGWNMLRVQSGNGQWHSLSDILPRHYRRRD